MRGISNFMEKKKKRGGVIVRLETFEMGGGIRVLNFRVGESVEDKTGKER